MTKPKYTEMEVAGVINKLFSEDPQLTYEELMGAHKRIIVYAKQKMKDNVTVQDRIKAITKRALILSVRKLAQSERIDLGYIQMKHMGLDRVARQVYARVNGKCPWRVLVEGSGLHYPSRQLREWNLKKLVERARTSRQEIEEIGTRGIYSYDSGFIGAARRIVGTFGKLAIIAGADFLTRPGANKRFYSFSAEELVRFTSDESLDEEEKTRAIFNALSLQHYSWGEYSSKVSRIISEGEDNFNLCQQGFFFHSNLESRLEQSQKKHDSLCVSLHLDNITNRFSRAGFYFHGENALDESNRFFHYLNGILTWLNNKI